MFTPIFENILSINTFFFIKWLYLDLSDFFLVFLISIAIWNLFTATSFRYKVYYFIINLCLFAIWGFSASFDGLVLMMLVTEFSVAIFFIFLFITAKFKKEQCLISKKLIWIHLLISIFLYFYSIDTSYSTFFFFFNNIYPYINDIVAHDLAIIYLFVLFFNPILTIHLSVILGLFSLFFICIFFTFKFLKQVQNTKSQDLLGLRKQLLYHQSNYGTRIRTFQKKKCSKKVVLVFQAIQVEFF